MTKKPRLHAEADAKVRAAAIAWRKGTGTREQVHQVYQEAYLWPALGLEYNKYNTKEQWEAMALDQQNALRKLTDEQFIQHLKGGPGLPNRWGPESL